jgi:Protein of unknown function (DUF998)
MSYRKRRALSAIACFIAFFAINSALHILRTDYDPLRRQLSEYALGSYGYLFSASLFLLAFGSALVQANLRHQISQSRPTQWGLRFLLLWCIGTVTAGVFPTDPNGIPVSIPGVLHGLGATLAFGSFLIAAWLLTLHMRTDPKWRTAYSAFLMLILIATLLFGFWGLPDSLRGGGEKVFVSAVVIWLMCLAWMEYQQDGEYE